jgi:hypothetical protein
MLAMNGPPVGEWFPKQYGLVRHKPKARAPVNMQSATKMRLPGKWPRLEAKAVDHREMAIEQDRQLR